MNSKDKKNKVKANYDLIAEQYARDFGFYIEDLDIYEEFEKQLSKGATILDLGAGTGRTYVYFNKKGYNYIGLDFSPKMKEKAYEIHGGFPYILDDMINIKKYFEEASVDAVFADYSLFHLPPEDLKRVFSDVYDILKVGGIFLFSYQVGTGEEFVDEPYLEQEGNKKLYMNYQTKDEIELILSNFKYTNLFKKDKIETVDGAINNNDRITSYMMVKKES